MHVKRISITLLICIALTSLHAEIFQFKYEKGDRYRMLSTVDESVYINGRYMHDAQIINRISVEVTDIQGEWAEHTVSFMTSEQSASQRFTWGTEYNTIFKRNPLGVYDIAAEYYMPVVRNVPVFPQKDIHIGETWTGNGEEVHDLREAFGITEPFRIPFSVLYTYEGVEKDSDAKVLHRILAQYTLLYKNPPPKTKTTRYPASTMGFSRQTIYWNAEQGAIDSYNEEFRIMLEMNDGVTIEYRGTAQSEVVDQKRQTQNQLQDLQDSILQAGIADAVVRSDEKGITISLENIQFQADSNILLASEKQKLQKIAPILKHYTGNDLLISGYTALAGNEQNRLVLSAQRAEAVAEYLISLGVKDAYHIFTQGLGAENPVADNNTEAGRARNRRVEITVLE